jgi:hypothetical protein
MKNDGQWLLTRFAICPDMLAISTRLPRTPFLTSTLAVCFAVRNVPVTFTRWMRSKSAAGYSIAATRCWMPAHATQP